MVSNKKFLIEKTKQELLNKSISADKVKSYGTTRYERRTKQQIVKDVSVYNKIDMNALFRANILSFIIPVKGETDTYNIQLIFEGICDEIKSNIKNNKNKLEFKCVYQAIINALNRGDILISCSCPDWKYRQSYYSTKQHYNSGAPESRPSNITNPNDRAGGGCKHVLAILTNFDWAMKLATSIYNYIKYMEKNETPKFVNVIFPKIFSISYKEYSNSNTQYGVGDKELSNSVDNEKDKEIINKANSTEYNPDVEEPEEGGK